MLDRTAEPLASPRPPVQPSAQPGPSEVKPDHADCCHCHEHSGHTHDHAHKATAELRPGAQQKQDESPRPEAQTAQRKAAEAAQLARRSGCWIDRCRGMLRLAELGPDAEPYAKVVVAGLNDAHERVRASAARALGELGGVIAMDYAKELTVAATKDTDSDVREAAQDTLRAIHRKPQAEASAEEDFQNMVQALFEAAAHEPVKGQPLIDEDHASAEGGEGQPQEEAPEDGKPQEAQPSTSLRLGNGRYPLHNCLCNAWY
eukprot:CAMPEP_0115422922 /NCGR_PEP_ID=MMETSP0271-20121206/27032_1 /TAXON_ID=71861 /ORGANISM="Scrippsiella trochoidea, Strain CCMP3099" /LENGTH=259 /DNA_ID=CAMNT_0002847641 /DNA_START=146 /DNA_END=925 /DNA_ORIENTATION=-